MLNGKLHFLCSADSVASIIVETTIQSVKKLCLCTSAIRVYNAYLELNEGWGLAEAVANRCSVTKKVSPEISEKSQENTVPESSF